MKIENIGNKIIGIGEVTVLPGETKDIPKAYETSPILEVYKLCGVAKIIGKTEAEERQGKEAACENTSAACEETSAGKKAADEAEALRQARLASLSGISEDNLIKLAQDLGINFAECKDQADMLKKVKAALKK